MTCANNFDFFAKLGYIVAKMKIFAEIYKYICIIQIILLILQPKSYMHYVRLHYFVLTSGRCPLKCGGIRT